jgi:hypothetical protein
MPRDVDAKKTRKAQRLIRKLAAKSTAPETIDPETGEVTGEVKPGSAEVDYSHWEQEFLTEVDERLEKYGSAFHDLSKGAGDDALSRLQAVKLKEIADKARGKTRKGLKTKKPLGWKKRAQPSRNRDD